MRNRTTHGGQNPRSVLLWTRTVPSSANPPLVPAAYFRKLGLSDDEARDLHNHYYKEYGLAIRGLVRHHKVDPLDYDKHCDASLPLETVLKVDPELQHLLASIDREKCHVWALTNAYVFVSSHLPTSSIPPRFGLNSLPLVFRREARHAGTPATGNLAVL